MTKYIIETRSLIGNPRSDAYAAIVRLACFWEPALMYFAYLAGF